VTPFYKKEVLVIFSSPTLFIIEPKTLLKESVFLWQKGQKFKKSIRY